MGSEQAGRDSEEGSRTDGEHGQTVNPPRRIAEDATQPPWLFSK